MKEIPMLFSTPMVQSLLAGRKTMTRRIIKHKLQPVRDEVISGRRLVKPSGWPLMNVDEYIERFCPYGKPGDLIWVRETLYQNGELGLEYVADKEHIDETIIPDDYGPYGGSYSFRNIPAIHMPKWAARIWLQKTATKVERACDISREDAIAEGLACISKDGGRTYKYGIPDLDGYPGNDDHGWSWQEWEVDPIEAFKKLWCKINGIETWNSWVWVNSFSVLSTTGKPSHLTEKI